MRRPWSGLLWSAAASMAVPALQVHLRRRARLGKELTGRLAERRGVETHPRPPGQIIWLHAASVGEAVSILPVLSELAGLQRNAILLLTTGTVTSAELIARRISSLGLEQRIIHRFAPLDVPLWVGRFLDHWRPNVGGIVESEWWPNLLHGCRQRAIPLMLINARLSARSLMAWRRTPKLARYVLESFQQIHARGVEDSDRLRSLGADTITITGDLKFAAPPLPVDEAELANLRSLLGARPVWLAASTHPGEEALIAAVHKRLVAVHRGLLTIIVPRHPERGPTLAAEFSAPRREAGQGPPDEGIWIADTIGELGLWYRLAQVTVIGRGLVAPGGGQNPLEAVRVGCPVVVGPYMDNFAEHVALLRTANALIEIQDAAGLTAAIDTLLGDPAERDARSARGSSALSNRTELPRGIANALLALDLGA